MACNDTSKPYSRNGLIGRLINYNQKTENASLSNGGLRPSPG